MSAPSSPWRAALAAALLLGLASCLGPQADQQIRYYAVELSNAPPTSSAPAGTLRVRRLAAAGHLREPMAVRTSEVTYTFLDSDRWTEPPLGYVATALDRALFESGAFARGEGGDAAVLDVELRAFELRRGPELEAVCTLAAKLTAAGGAALLDRSFEARVSVADGSPTALARGLSKALERAVQELASAAR